MVTKSGNMTFVYGAVALLSVLLLIGYLLWEKKKERRFMALFSCVAVVNCGYFRQAVAHTLTGAMMVNRLSYLGAACSMLVMLLIIMDVCRIRRVKWVAGILAGFLFGEVPGLIQLAGGALILGGVYSYSKIERAAG